MVALVRISDVISRTLEIARLLAAAMESTFDRIDDSFSWTKRKEKRRDSSPWNSLAFLNNQIDSFL